MSLSPEAVSQFNQSVLTAALLLALISVPKLLALTSWYAYKEWVFENLDRVARSRVLQMAAAEEGTSQLPKKEAEDTRARVLKTATETYGGFTKSARDPLIEAFVAVIILFFLIPVFSGIAIWIAAVFIIALSIALFSLALTALLWRNANKMISEHPSESQAQD